LDAILSKKVATRQPKQTRLQTNRKRDACQITAHESKACTHRCRKDFEIIQKQISTACPAPAAWHPPGHPTANPTPKKFMSISVSAMQIAVTYLFIYASLGFRHFFVPQLKSNWQFAITYNSGADSHEISVSEPLHVHQKCNPKSILTQLDQPGTKSSQTNNKTRCSEHI